MGIFCQGVFIFFLNVRGGTKEGIMLMKNFFSLLFPPKNCNLYRDEGGGELFKKSFGIVAFLFWNLVIKPRRVCGGAF